MQSPTAYGPPCPWFIMGRREMRALYDRLVLHARHQLRKKPRLLSLVDEAVAETLADATEGWQHYTPVPAGPLQWLKTLLDHNLSDLATTAARGGATGYEPNFVSTGLIDTQPAQTPTPEDDAIAADNARQMAGKLQTLSRAHRDAFILTGPACGTYTAAAALLDKPIGTVKSDAHRAAKTLTAQIDQTPADVPPAQPPGTGMAALATLGDLLAAATTALPASQLHAVRAAAKIALDQYAAQPVIRARAGIRDTLFGIRGDGTRRITAAVESGAEDAETWDADERQIDDLGTELPDEDWLHTEQDAQLLDEWLSWLTTAKRRRALARAIVAGRRFNSDEQQATAYTATLDTLEHVAAELPSDLRRCDNAARATLNLVLAKHGLALPLLTAAHIERLRP